MSPPTLIPDSHLKEAEVNIYAAKSTDVIIKLRFKVFHDKVLDHFNTVRKTSLPK